MAKRVVIKNLNGTMDKKCNCCPTWMDHWLIDTGSRRTVCGVLNCGNPFEVGAHVKVVGKGDGRHYIAPLCRTHNHKSNQDEMALCFGVKLARPNHEG